jgi:hypothetical protein
VTRARDPTLTSGGNRGTSATHQIHRTYQFFDALKEINVKALLRRFAAPALAALSLSACSSDPEMTETKAQLSDGKYAVAFGDGFAKADEQDILGITAEVNRSSAQVVFTLADGTASTFTWAPRSEDTWPGDCATMNSAVKGEVADLSPAPVELLSLKLDTPVVYAKCSPTRMILTNNPLWERPSLVFDLQP